MLSHPKSRLELLFRTTPTHESHLEGTPRPRRILGAGHQADDRQQNELRDIEGILHELGEGLSVNLGEVVVCRGGVGQKRQFAVLHRRRDDTSNLVNEGLLHCENTALVVLEDGQGCRAKASLSDIYVLEKSCIVHAR